MILDFVTLEDNKSYAVIETIEYKDNRYVVFANEEDPSIITVRKVISEEGKEYFVKLDTEEEFDELMIYYNNIKNGEK